ncbi:helix-turn-helix domain-containing protein [Nocardioides sp. YIM 152315]|uniref:TetR/AcrR family transcriptional regulator n=1 Tax=Nocardioides sp. YIM 152315 TaxID=3031760 RepID=UPI0023DBA5A6|nr:helix-turn-helix domain-containing protein [Nocardioides sp. YIM 152315]MDF1603780.1 helix-turn-helix domain containing protein [Nocardioides sp. YIM 152315]
MAPGMRERWRTDAMRSIRRTALDLFDQRGFAAVRIDDVAAAAGVSASSIYRYFGTKEGLLVADEFDSMSEAEVREIFDPEDPVGSMVRAVQRYEAAPDPAPDLASDPASGGVSTAARRIRYFFDEPSVRQALFASLDRAAQRIAPLMVSDTTSVTQARAAAHALAFAYFGALEQWYVDGGQRPIGEYVEEGLGPLRRIWSPVT